MKSADNTFDKHRAPAVMASLISATAVWRCEVLIMRPRPPPKAFLI